MEPPLPEHDPGPSPFPAWIEPLLVPDSSFSRAYAELGDRTRSLLKGLIARQYALCQPAAPLALSVRERHGDFAREYDLSPIPFALILVDAQLAAPAFLLAALLPALCARVPRVLVGWLGPRGDAPASLLTACELAGQERVAALGPVQGRRLLEHCAAFGRPGLVLHPETAAFSRLLLRAPLAERLADSPLRLRALRAPLHAALWRDAPNDPPAEDVALLYGALALESGGPGCGPDAQDWPAFCGRERELLLYPEGRQRPDGAGLAVSSGCLGMWRWPDLGTQTFLRRREVFTSA